MQHLFFSKSADSTLNKPIQRKIAARNFVLGSLTSDSNFTEFDDDPNEGFWLRWYHIRRVQLSEESFIAIV